VLIVLTNRHATTLYGYLSICEFEVYNTMNKMQFYLIFLQMEYTVNVMFRGAQENTPLLPILMADIATVMVGVVGTNVNHL
jgi:hypothetical protein